MIGRTGSQVITIAPGFDPRCGFVRNKLGRLAFVRISAAVELKPVLARRSSGVLAVSQDLHRRARPCLKIGNALLRCSRSLGESRKMLHPGRKSPDLRSMSPRPFGEVPGRDQVFASREQPPFATDKKKAASLRLFCGVEQGDAATPPSPPGTQQAPAAPHGATPSRIEHPAPRAASRGPRHGR